MSRSPNNWESTLRYGVSPQPAQAPENSNSGCRNWVPRTVPKSTRDRSFTGRVSKNAMFSRPAASSGPPGAVLQVDLERVPGVRQAAHLQRHGLEAGRRAGQLRLVVELGPDHAVRADETALPALDAQVRIPDRDQVGDVALLEGRGAARVGPVHGQRADRQVVPTARHHLRGDRADELRRA